MKTLGPNTKAALSRLVYTLPYLRSDAASVPTDHRGFWQRIKDRYAGAHFPQGASDPLHDAALAHAEEEIATALEADEKAAAPAPAPVVESLPELPAPVAPVETSTLPLGDLPVSPDLVPVPEKEEE